MNVLNQYLQITCIGKGNVGFLMNGPRLVAVSDRSVKDRLEKTGFPQECGFIKADAVKELSKTHESVVECCLFITVTDARKLGIINKEDEIIFNEPSRLN